MSYRRQRDKSEPLTDRQKAYREYLLTEHWAKLKAACFERDHNECVECLDDEEIQCHHVVYRTPFEAGTLEDVKTLCRCCHRMAHGFAPGPTRFERKAREMTGMINREVRPSVADWKQFAALRKWPWQWEQFGSVMFWYITMFRPPGTARKVKVYWDQRAAAEGWRNGMAIEEPATADNL